MKTLSFIFLISFFSITQCSAMSKEQQEEYENQVRLNKIKSRYDEIQMLCASLISQIHKKQPTPIESFTRIFNLADDLKVNIPLCPLLDASIREDIKKELNGVSEMRVIKAKS